MTETSFRNGLADVSLPALEIFVARAELLAFTADVLGAVAGKSLVVVTGNQETTDVLGLTSQLDCLVQSATRVPAQADRPGVSVATYATMNRLVRESYGHLQLNLSAFDLVLLHDPHTLPLSTLRNTADTVEELPVMVGAVMPRPSEKALLSELFLDEASMTGCDAHSEEFPRYDAVKWGGRRRSADWWYKRACRDTIESPGGNGLRAEYYREIREQHCSDCPVADSCLQTGLEFEEHMSAKHGSMPPGAWGGLSSYARRELATMLRQGASKAAADYLVSRSRNM